MHQGSEEQAALDKRASAHVITCGRSHLSAWYNGGERQTGLRVVMLRRYTLIGCPRQKLRTLYVGDCLHSGSRASVRERSPCQGCCHYSSLARALLQKEFL